MRKIMIFICCLILLLTTGCQKLSTSKEKNNANFPSSSKNNAFNNLSESPSPSSTLDSQTEETSVEVLDETLSIISDMEETMDTMDTFQDDDL